MTIYATVFSISLALLLILIIWELIWVPTWKCHYQDRLWRLRKEVFKFFKTGDYRYKDYSHVRAGLVDILDSQIRGISRVSFSSLFAFRRGAKNNHELKEYYQVLDEIVESQFQVEDKEIKAFIVRTRSDASKSLSCFMFYRNPFFVLLIAMLYIFIFPLYITAVAADIITKLDLKKIINFKRIEQFVCTLFV